MKITIIIIVVILIAFLVLMFLGKSDESITTIGDIDNIEHNIKNLMENTNEYAFLIIKIQGTEDFIQFTGNANGVQLDLPLITDRQKVLESAFMDAASDLNLDVIENKGTDGSSFLDIDLNGNVSEITNVVRQFIGKLFNVNSSTKLIFEYNI